MLSRSSVPLRDSHWIPIQNSSKQNRGLEDQLHFSSGLLTLLIAFVASSLFSLIYLTVRTYRVSVQHPLVEEILDCQTLKEFESELNQTGLNLFSQAHDSRGCVCGLGNHHPPNPEGYLSKNLLYSEAHHLYSSHRPSCTTCPMSHYSDSTIMLQRSMAEHPSTKLYHDSRAFQANCCLTTDLGSPPAASQPMEMKANRITMIENPSARDL